MLSIDLAKKKSSTEANKPTNKDTENVTKKQTTKSSYTQNKEKGHSEKHHLINEASTKTACIQCTANGMSRLHAIFKHHKVKAVWESITSTLDLAQQNAQRSESIKNDQLDGGLLYWNTIQAVRTDLLFV